MSPKIFIDGEHGTTGLQIRERLERRGDIELLSLPVDERRDEAKRTSFLRQADIAILCLPDDAARQAVELAAGSSTRFIDASTAHRTADDWVYGFAEMTEGQAERIAGADKVSNPGCYSTGAIALLRPLSEAGLLPADYPVAINAVSGYSGGGKQMIAQMEDPASADPIASNHFSYALTLRHKHVPEIMKQSRLARRPIFTPAVGRFAQGMLVHLPLHLDLLIGRPSLGAVHEAIAEHYRSAKTVTVEPVQSAGTMVRIDPEQMNGTDEMTITVLGTEGDNAANIVACLDNLGKGASGAAVQNLDLMLGKTPV